MLTPRQIERTQDWLYRMEMSEGKRDARGRCDSGTYSCDCSCGESKTLHSAMVVAAWHMDHVRQNHTPRVTWLGWRAH